MKNKNKRIIFISVSLLIVLILGVVILNSLKRLGQSSVKEVEVLNKIEEYDYVLKDNAPTLYKTKFEELKVLLEQEIVDETKYISLVSEMFIIDFFNLNNKFSKNDVGGLEFVDPLIRDNFKLKATDTIYKYIETNLTGNRKQVLPSVKSTSILSVKDKENIKYLDNKYYDKEGFIVKISWVYEKDLGYQTEAVLKLVHNDNKIDIVEISNEEEGNNIDEE